MLDELKASLDPRDTGLLSVSDEISVVLHLLTAAEMAVHDLPPEQCQPLFYLVSVIKAKLAAALDVLEHARHPPTADLA
jgi:hypothetical protein